MSEVSVRDFILADLQDAWRAAEQIAGPALGDRTAPLPARIRAFSERIGMFRRVMAREPPPPAAEPGFFDDLLAGPA